MKTNKLTNYQILKILIRAKKTYKNREGIGVGMCAHIAQAFYDLYDKNVYYNDIILFIPEFHWEHLNNGKRLVTGYWWPIADKKSRIKAFNKLIRLYIFKTIFNYEN